MKLLHRILLICCAFFPGVTRAMSSDPVGALRLKLRGNSDTVVSLPLHRPALVEATLTSRTDNQLELDAAIPALPDEGAYVLVMSGALEGAVLSVTSRSGNTITVSAGDYDLSSLQSGALVAVIPYWSLDTVFPGGSGVNISTSPLSPKTHILFYDEHSQGTNPAPTDSYFYFAGNSSKPAGWYLFGDMSQRRGATRFPPHRYFIVRNSANADTTLLVTGAVQMSGFNLPLTTTQPAVDRDNLIALPVPVPITLAETELQQSGAFAASTSALSPKDLLLVFSNTTIGQNKPPVASYFYFGGDGSHTAGWYLFGDMSQTVDHLELKPGEGYIVRKARTPSSEVRFWTGLPSYLQ